MSLLNGILNFGSKNSKGDNPTKDDPKSKRKKTKANNVKKVSKKSINKKAKKAHLLKDFGSYNLSFIGNRLYIVHGKDLHYVYIDKMGKVHSKTDLPKEVIEYLADDNLLDKILN